MNREESMDALEPLTRFLSLIKEDPRIGPVHISLYVALLERWEVQERRNPISFFSYEIMPVCKIAGIATYHRCIKELHTYRYIKYIPSYNHHSGSKVYILPLEELKITVD